MLGVATESTQIVLDRPVIPVLSARYDTLDMFRAHAYRTTLSDHISNLNFILPALLGPLENSASHTREGATPPWLLTAG